MFEKKKLKKIIREGSVDELKAFMGRHRGLLNHTLDNFHLLPLTYTFQCERDDMAEALLELGANVNLPDYHRNTLCNAADYGRTQMLIKIATQAPHLLEDRVLHYAAKAGDAEMVSFLLARGLNPLYKDSYGQTPCHYAQQAKNEAALSLLQPYIDAENERHLARNQVGDRWQVTGADTIAWVHTETAIGYRVTELFNFASLQHTRIYRNLETDQESVETLDLRASPPAPTVLEAYRRLGDSGAVLPALPSAPKLL